jgi:hypothetical protein
MRAWNDSRYPHRSIFCLGFVLVLWMIGERRRDVLHGPYVTKEVAMNLVGVPYRGFKRRAVQ